MASATVCIEVCAGCARLSSTLKAAGFKTIAVDHSKNRHKQLQQCIDIDMASDDCVDQIFALLDSHVSIFYLHCAPPCGTASRARERRIPFRLRRRGIPDPKPLRSSKYPQGLPTLHGTNLKRVTTANSIYKNVAKLIERALEAGAIITVENPTRSYMWETSWFSKLIQKYNLFPVNLQQCMFGGQRDKWSTFYTNDEQFSCMAVSCDRSHNHLPWSVSKSQDGVVFDTASEAEYPQKLCDALTSVVRQSAIQKGITFDTASKSAKTFLSSKIRAAQAGRQPRGSLLPQIISEFKELKTIDMPTEMPRNKQTLSAEQCKQFSVPPGSKFVISKGGFPVQDLVNIGIYRSTVEFTKEACEISHPFDNCSTVDDGAKQCIFQLLTGGVESTNRKREENFRHYEDLATELCAREHSLHDAMGQQSGKLMADKKILLFDAMCKDAGVEDEGLLELLCGGVKLTGQGSRTNLFEENLLEPSLTDHQLMKSSKWTKRMILGKSSLNSSEDVKRSVWKGALEEVAKGWLQGPLTEDEVKNLLGPLYIVSKRFGLQQSDKIRPIDDMSESKVNSAYGSSYKLDLPGVDGISILARTLLECVHEDRSVRLDLSDGSELRGALHESLTLDEARSLTGRTLDLEAAYKQMMVAPSSLWSSVLAIEAPNGKKELFISRALPFGASAAVYAFNRVARALQLIGERLFSLIWTNYFDDYPQLDILPSGNSAQLCAERLLSLLGWNYSCKPSKRLPIAQQFDALGVTFDFSDSCLGRFVVRNKSSRVAQIVEAIAAIRQSGELSVATASSLRGKLQFAETHTYGRMISANLRVLQSRASGKHNDVSLNDTLRAELDWARSFVLSDNPRVLKARMSGDRLVIFTDAALEGNDDVGSVGMCAYWIHDGKVVNRYYFGERIPTDLLRRLQVGSKKIIAALELFAAVSAVVSLTRIHPNSRTFVFIDNEAARASMIAMYSVVKVHNELLKKLSVMIQRNGVFLWVARVPSPSNPADAPSRLDCSAVIAEGSHRTDVMWDLINT